MPVPQKLPFGFGASSPSLPVDPLADDQDTPLWLRVSSSSQGAPPSQAPPPAANPQPAAPPRPSGLLQLPTDPDPAPMRLALMQSTLGSGPQRSSPGAVLPQPAPQQTPQAQTQAQSQQAQPQQRPLQPAPQQPGQQELSGQSKAAIQNSRLSSDQADALESAVKAAGQKYGIDPNDLIGIAFAESTLGAGLKNPKSSASGLYGLTNLVKNMYGLSPSDAIGLSPDAITKQTNAAAGYLHELMRYPHAAHDPEHKFQIALAYYRGKQKPINSALDGAGGYQDMLNLRFNDVPFSEYLKQVKTLQKTPKPQKVKTPR